MGYVTNETLIPRTLLDLFVVNIFHVFFSVAKGSICDHLEARAGINTGVILM